MCICFLSKCICHHNLYISQRAAYLVLTCVVPYVLQNKPVMVFGLLSISVCVGYLGYLHAMKDNDQTLYEATDSEGEKYMRRKTSKWD